MAIEFKEYCDNFAVVENVAITDDRTIPDEYKKTVEKVIDDLKLRVDDFDEVSINYIQLTLDAVKDFESALSHTKGNIPDGIMNVLAIELYGKEFNELDDDKKSIIITVSTYICVARNKKLQ